MRIDRLPSDHRRGQIAFLALATFWVVLFALMAWDVVFEHNAFR